MVTKLSPDGQGDFDIVGYYGFEDTEKLPAVLQRAGGLLDKTPPKDSFAGMLLKPVKKLFNALAGKKETGLPPIIHTSPLEGVATCTPGRLGAWLSGSTEDWKEAVTITIEAVRDEYGKWELTEEVNGYGCTQSVARALSDDSMLGTLLTAEYADAHQKGFRGYKADLILQKGPQAPRANILHVLYDQAVQLRAQRLASAAAPKQQPQLSPR